MNVINERYIKDTEDILYNKDKFDSGEINICFITGLSGSGKSTMARGVKAEVYELDDVMMQWEFTDENLKEYGDLIYSFFKTSGKKWRGTSEEIDEKWKGTDDEYEKTLTEAFVKYSINYAKSHKDTKFIIEGVWLFHYIKPEMLKNYAVYIKGTSVLKSRFRSALRDSKDATKKTERLKAMIKIMLKNHSNYFKNEKIVQQWRDYYSKLMKDVKEAMSIHKDGNEVKFVQEAEIELYARSSLLMESAEANFIGLVALDEGIKETIQEYVEKIKNGINQAFDKLKEIIETKQNEALKQIAENIQNDTEEPKFEIENYCEYDTNKLRDANYAIKPLDYEEMKDTIMESKQAFIQKYYPSLYDEELSIKEKLLKDIKGQPRDTQCTNQMLSSMVNFCLEGYKPIYDQIEKDKDIISTSCDAAKTVADSIDNTPQPSPNDVKEKQESVLFFLEADDDKGDKMGFKDAPDAKVKNNSPVKIISTYCSISTSVYSAKMKALNTVRSEYYRILLHQARLKGWKIIPAEKK